MAREFLLENGERAIKGKDGAPMRNNILINFLFTGNFIEYFCLSLLSSLAFIFGNYFEMRVESHDRQRTDAYLRPCNGMHQAAHQKET